MGRLSLHVLSEVEIERIHQRSLDVLEQAGVRVLDAECQRVLTSAGARLDEASDIVRIPRQLVEEVRRLAPPILEIHHQDGRPIWVGGAHRVFGSLVIDPWVIDYDTLRPRRPALSDLIRHTRLGDALPIVDDIHRMDMPPQDLPPDEAYVRSLAAFATNTTKHLIALPASIESARDWLEVAEMYADGQPLGRRRVLSFGVAITSPLALTGVNAWILKEGVRRGMATIPVVCPMAGTTSPLTFAGTLLISNAENLFFITLAQLLSPGAPVLYGAGPSLTDLRSGYDIYYNADKMLWKTALVQMGKFYGLPITGETGGSLVGRHDMQCGIESALLMLPSIVCGQNMMGGLGSCYNAVGMSAEMIIIQADLAALLMRLADGMDTREETLGLESILRAGPGGHFLEDPLTLRMLRSGEFFTAGVFDRLGEHGMGRPEESMLARAHARVEEILATHTPALPGHIIEDIQRWASRRLAGAKA